MIGIVVARVIAIVIVLLLKIYSISLFIITKLEVEAVICLEQETAQEKNKTRTENEPRSGVFHYNT